MDMKIVDFDEPDVVVGGTGCGSCCFCSGGGAISWKDRPSKTRPYFPFIEALLMIAVRV